jgi:hypothetical protein
MFRQIKFESLRAGKESSSKKPAQQSVHPTLGILARFQTFFYASAFSSRTAFRRPPQRG